MRVLFVERCLTENSLVFDQIRRIHQHVETCTIAVQTGRFPHFKHPGVVSVRCPNFPKIEAVKSRLFTRAALRAFKGLPSKRSFDLVHAHMAYPEGLAALHIAKSNGLPLVITGRGSAILLYPARNAYLRRAVSDALSGADAVVAVSRHLCRAAIDLGAAEDRCHHIPDGVSEEFLEVETKNNAQTGHDGKIVLFAGALLPVKNIMRMIEAFAVVACRRDDVIFQLAGEGPLRRDAEKLVNRCGLSDRLRFLGQLPPARLASRMREADLLCLPSLSEGWGNVITEAMACGTPVVGATLGGIPEQIVSNEYGFLCDPHSPKDITGKLVAALEKRWDHEKIAQRGKMYTREASALKIVNVYEKVLTSCAR